MPPSSRNVRLRVGRNIRRLRKRHTWSLLELALRANTTQRYVREVELGRVSVGIDFLAKLASALSVDVADLVGPSPKRRGTTEMPTRAFNQLLRAFENAIATATSGQAEKKKPS
jgi:transcriptional regulator with XRE-family HTH domain